VCGLVPVTRRPVTDRVSWRSKNRPNSSTATGNGRPGALTSPLTWIESGRGCVYVPRMLSGFWPWATSTATKESTLPAWIKVTWPDSAGGTYAGSVSRQYDTRWYKPYSESVGDAPPLYEGHTAGWCGAVSLLQATAIAAPTAPKSQIMSTGARRVIRRRLRGLAESVYPRSTLCLRL